MSNTDIKLMLALLAVMALVMVLKPWNRKDYKAESEAWMQVADQKEALVERLSAERDSLNEVVSELRNQIRREKKRTKELRDELEKIPFVAADMELDSVAGDVSRWLVEERPR